VRRQPGSDVPAWSLSFAFLWLWPLTSHDGHVRAYGSYVDSVAYPDDCASRDWRNGFARTCVSPAWGLMAALPRGDALDMALVSRNCTGMTLQLDNINGYPIPPSSPELVRFEQVART